MIGALLMAWLAVAGAIRANGKIVGRSRLAAWLLALAIGLCFMGAGALMEYGVRSIISWWAT
jgi:hypothetical protein